MYLEAISDLISRYEDDHHAIAVSDPVAVLRHLMEANGVNQATLHRETGIAKSNISEVLSGKRSISRSQMRKLAEYFHVPASVFLGGE
jgi:HTH-type transcriptional regulator/antitoxin HigA